MSIFKAAAISIIAVSMSACVPQANIQDRMVTYKVPHLTLDRDQTEDPWISIIHEDPVFGGHQFGWTVLNGDIDNQSSAYGFTIWCELPSNKSGLNIKVGGFAPFIGTANPNDIIAIRFDDDPAMLMIGASQDDDFGIQIHPPRTYAQRAGFIGMKHAPTTSKQMFQRMLVAKKAAISLENWDGSKRWVQVFDLSGLDNHLPDIQRICPELFTPDQE